MKKDQKHLTFFKVYKNEVEVGSKLKKLRTDNKGVYNDHSYFQLMGIIHETTAGYAPQSTGVAKKKTHSL